MWAAGSLRVPSVLKGHSFIDTSMMTSDNGTRLIFRGIWREMQHVFDCETDKLRLELVCSQYDGRGMNPSAVLQVYLGHAIRSAARKYPNLNFDQALLERMKKELAEALPRWEIFRAADRPLITSISFE